MNYGIAITHLVLVLTVSGSLALAALDVPRVPPKGAEGPDVRRTRGTDCHGVEGPDARHHASASCRTL